MEVKICLHCASVFLPRPSQQKRSVYCPAPDCQQARKVAYQAQPEVKARKRASQAVQRAQPGVRAQKAAYQAEYRSQPEVKAQMAAYCAWHNARPDVKARRNVRERERAATRAAKARAFDELMQMTGVSL